MHTKQIVKDRLFRVRDRLTAVRSCTQWLLQRCVLGAPCGDAEGPAAGGAEAACAGLPWWWICLAIFKPAQACTCF